MIAKLNSPAVGIGYMLWLRVRWVLTAMALIVAVLAIAIQVFPSAEEAVLLGVFWLALPGAPLLTYLSFGPTDLGVRGSGFPRDMLVLPLRTRSLVGLPMLIGVVISVVLYLPAIAWYLAPNIDALGGLFQRFYLWSFDLPRPLQDAPSALFVIYGCTAAAVAHGALVAMTGKPAPIERPGSLVPADLARITFKCLARDRNARYATAGELAAALEPYTASAG